MTAPLTPGAYLARRREARGVTIAAIARDMRCTPPLPEHERVALLAAIEADEQPASAATIDQLLVAFDFDRHVLGRLVDLHYSHADLPHPRLCRICACSEWDPCAADLAGAGSCRWVAPDLCSACVGDADADARPAAANDAPHPPLLRGYDPGAAA